MRKFLTFNSICPSNYDCEEERDKLDELIHLEEQQGLHNLRVGAQHEGTSRDPSSMSAAM